MREKIIEQINNRTLDSIFLYEYYRHNGGTAPFQVFNKVLSLFTAGIGIIDFFQKLIVKYEVNLLYDKNNELIKAY